MRWLLVPLALPVALVGVVASASAAAPIYDVQTRWGPQNLEPGGTGEFIVTIHNEGFEPTDGTPITMTLQLPPGVTRIAPLPADPSNLEGDGWFCEGSSTVTCTSYDAIGSITTDHNYTSWVAPYIFLRVAVAPEAT